MVQLARKAKKSISPRLSIVVPVFNEARSFSTVFKRLLEKKVEGLDTEIIVVESNSTDGTREQAAVCRPSTSEITSSEPDATRKRSCRTSWPERNHRQFRNDPGCRSGYDLEDYEALLEPLLRIAPLSCSARGRRKHMENAPVRASANRGDDFERGTLVFYCTH